MKRALFLLAVVAVALSGCKSKVPETKRFPNATIQFQYRETAPYQVEFQNCSSNELEANIWRFGASGRIDRVSDEHPYFNYGSYSKDRKVYKVILTCVDQERLKVPADNYTYSFEDSVWFYTDSAYILVWGDSIKSWSYGNTIPDELRSEFGNDSLPDISILDSLYIHGI